MESLTRERSREGVSRMGRVARPYRWPVRCCGYHDFFDARVARIDATRYRNRGLRRSARRIVDLARGVGLGGVEVLEIGGGVGALSPELVRAGAVHATTIELSPGYEQEGIALAAETGLEDCVERR